MWLPGSILNFLSGSVSFMGGLIAATLFAATVSDSQIPQGGVVAGDFPNLLFLAFFGFPCLFLFKEFPFIPRDFRGSASLRNPCLFCRNPCLFLIRKGQGKEDQGWGVERLLI